MSATKLKFGEFELNVASYELSRLGQAIKLERIPMELLLLLVDRHSQLVTRDEILEKLWGKEVFLDSDNSINTAISKIRVVLKDSPENPAFIKTVSGKGYRFIAPITISLDEKAAFMAPLGNVQAAEEAAVATGAAKTQSKVPSKPRGWKLGAAIAAGILAALSAGWFWHDAVGRMVSSGRAPVIRSIAVLPLENLTGDPSQEYFADGMTDALITDLAQIGALRVISRTSVMRYKGTRKALPEIARELGVDGIVEGTVTRSADRVHITSQLIYAPEDQHLWARSYERDLSDVLALQGQLAGSIADEVRAAVTPERRAQLSARAMVNPRAYEANLKGRYFWNKRRTEALPKALEYFQEAVGKDPTYAPAYAGLADTYAQFANWGLLPPREVMPKANAAAVKALEIDEHLSEAHVSLGMVRLAYDWDWPAAGKHFEQALALNPADPAAHQWYSNYLMVLGKSEESLKEAQLAVNLDPASPDMNHHVAWLLAMAGRYDEAIEQEHRTLEMDPEFPPAHSVLAAAYEAIGMHAEALAEVRRFSPLSSGSSAALSSSAYIHARSGGRSRALYELGQLRALSKRRYVPSLDFALVYFELGDKDLGFRWLEKASEERSGYLPWLKVSAKWAPLRSDPRFSDLLRHVGPPE